MEIIKQWLLAFNQTLMDLESASYEGLRSKLKADLNAFRVAMLKQGLSDAQIESMEFALVALADERIFKSTWQNKERWMQSSLQYEFYTRECAGEEFYTRLNQLLAVAANPIIIGIYYFCLGVGFRGQYDAQPQLIPPLLEKIRQHLNLTPKPYRYQLTAFARSKKLKTILWTCLLIFILVYVSLQWHLSQLQAMM